jgi:hypothetical protein
MKVIGQDQVANIPSAAYGSLAQDFTVLDGGAIRVGNGGETLRRSIVRQPSSLFADLRTSSIFTGLFHRCRSLLSVVARLKPR